MAVTFPTLDRLAVKKIARQLAPAYLLYNPSPNWIREEYNGTVFFFPPELGGELVDHPALRDASGEPIKVVADGVYQVRDRYGIIYDTKTPASGKFGYNRPILDGDGKVEEETADKVVTFFTNKFGEGAQSAGMAIGITMLTGDADTDVQIKLQAKKLWIKSQLAWAQSERSSRQITLEAWKKMNPGRTDYPPMNPRQIAAEEILMESETDAGSSKFAYVCPEGDYETNDLSKFQKHTKVRHPDFEVTEQGVIEVPAVAAKRGRGRPKKQLAKLGPGEVAS